MQQGDPRSTAFTYLFNHAARTRPIRRVSPTEIIVDLEDSTVLFPVDERDQRVLVVFDGDIPWGGLPKKASQIGTESRTVTLNVAHLRNQREKEEKCPPSLVIDGEEARLTLCRRFILLPARTRSIVRRYKPESFAAQYAMIDVDVSEFKGQEVAMVTWTTSSY